MKKLYLLLAAILIASTTFAQQQLATLNHNDSITVYYGTTALQQAYNASVDGDIITLSSGSFAAVNISKAVTIRGAGMYADSVARTAPTIITGDITIDHANGTLASHIRFEGVRFVENFFFENTNYPEFIKCEFQLISGKNMQQNGYDKYLSHATFINCVIKELQVVKRYPYYNYYTYSARTYIRNSSFVNCALLSVYNFDQYNSNTTMPVSNNSVNANGTNNTFNNCIVKIHPAEAHNYSINNSILYYAVEDSSSSALAYNSIGINNDITNANYFVSTILNGQNLHNYNSFSSVFKTFTGTYTSGGTSFDLQESIANSILGTDGTQVGIYGGAMPFDPYVRHPLVRRCNVASRSTADGKLAVDIEIVSE